MRVQARKKQEMEEGTEAIEMGTASISCQDFQKKKKKGKEFMEAGTVSGYKQNDFPSRLYKRQLAS